jgi:hypothetical protein
MAICSAGHTTEDKKVLLDSLHADGAVISGYLPRDTWLVVARLEDLRSSVYGKHVLVSMRRIKTSQLLKWGTAAAAVPLEWPAFMQQ